MKIGAFVGKFYPPHIGHISAIDYSLTKCDIVYIIISKNKMRNTDIQTKNNFLELDADLIKKWFTEHYKNNPKIKVEIFDETGLRPYPLDRDIWADKFKKQFPDVNVKIADEGYREYNQEYFPDYDFLAIDRDAINIHSTYIRDNMEKYFDYIIPEAQEYFKNHLKKGETKWKII